MESNSEPESFPNYEDYPDSPELMDPGVAIKLLGRDFEVGKPITLRGSYDVTGEFLNTMKGDPLKRVLVIVVRRDHPDLWSGLVYIEKVIIPESEDDGPFVADETFGGYFNIDLMIFTDIHEPGRYWVLASLGDYVSKRVEFEVGGEASAIGGLDEDEDDDYKDDDDEDDDDDDDAMEDDE